MPTTTVYVGLGANLGDRGQALQAAVHAMAALPGTQLQAVSSLYSSAPIEATGPDYLNAVAVLTTDFGPEAFLQQLQHLEQAAGRQRPYRNAPRTLDLDILLWGQAQLNTPNLTVPHPRMRERAFVLRPLQDIWPQVHWSEATNLVTLLQQPALAQQTLEPWPEPRWLAARANYSTPLRSTP